MPGESEAFAITAWKAIVPAWVTDRVIFVAAAPAGSPAKRVPFKSLSLRDEKRGVMLSVSFSGSLAVKEPSTVSIRASTTAVSVRAFACLSTGAASVGTGVPPPLGGRGPEPGPT